MDGETSISTETRRRGAEGELIAARWLESNGFELLARNWRSGRYELDIVARGTDGAIHFVEVKSRKPGSLTSPEEAITPAKFRSLLAAARDWLLRNEPDAESRFDLVAVQGDRVRYIPDAMTPAWQSNRYGF